MILRWLRPLAFLGVILLVGAFLLMKGRRDQPHARVAAAGDLSRAAPVIDAPIGDAPPQEAGVDTPPELPNGKVAWFLRKYSERYASAQHQMAIEEGADTDLLPGEWPGARYIADAGAYPAVETYFLGYLRYLERAKERYPVLMDSIARVTVLEAKLGSEDSAGVMQGISQGIASKRQANAETINDGEAYGQAALRLHYFLASLSSRVSYDSEANTARFAVDEERKKASMLVSDLQSSEAKLRAAASSGH